MSVVVHAALGHGPLDVGRETDGLQKALINAALNPASIILRVVNIASGPKGLLLKWPGRLACGKRVVVAGCR